MGLRDWQSHPVVMLGGAFSAGLAIALTVAIPLYSTSIQNASDAKISALEEKYAREKVELQAQITAKLKSLEEEYASDRDGIASVKNLREENAFLRAQAAASLVKLYQISSNKPFVAGNVIPIGFDAIKVGMPTSRLYSLFPKAGMTSANGFIYVALRNGFFEELQMDAPKGVILDVNYYVRDTAADRANLHAAVTAAFGEPATVSPSIREEATVYTWKVGDREVSVYGSQYSIHQAKPTSP